ncbi:MTRF1L release factor glutamine methyltransferase-like [Mya arenaria]|uniref:MTRF1L release factor glutamine methyltransferase-like n=1 Tax=Mya arenaria TaxID=6604 RepID=UPI0022E5A239|nr:MTRF1L release factor glutamine methyltransferase-like [Mya arenaria]
MVLFIHGRHGYAASLTIFRQCLRRHSSSFGGSLPTLGDVLAHWTQNFRERGIDEPESSAELILAHAVDKNMVHEVDLSRAMTKTVAARMEHMCRRRMKREPVAYIIGEWDFHDLTLHIRPPVLIPRPETEELAALALAGVHACGSGSKLRESGALLDVGSGSGALAVFLLTRLPGWRGVSVDISPVACELTTLNARRHRVFDRLSVHQGDIHLDSTFRDLASAGPYDIVVSNPPYITEAEMAALQPEVALHEDRGALCGGTDGMVVTRRLLNMAASLLRPHTGRLYLELGLGQPAEVERLVRHGLHDRLRYLHTRKDFTNRERFCELAACSGADGSS